MRRCHELIGDGKIHQFGIRSGERAEFEWAKSGHTDFHPLKLDGLEAVVEDLKKSQLPVYLTVDLDVLDPSVFPGTGTPEAGGVSFNELREALMTVCSRLNVVGLDVNELAPTLDPTGVSTATAGKLVRELLLTIDS